MAYPAIDSLIQTLDLFRRTYPSLIYDQAADMIDSLHASAEYFQNILEKTSHRKHEYEKIKDLEGDIRVAVQQAEDLLESNILEIMRERSSQQEEKNNGSKWTIHDEAWVLLRDLPQAIDKIDAVRKDLTQECSTSTNANAHSTGAAEDHFFKTGDCSSPKCASTALLQDIRVGLDDALTKIIQGLLGSAFEREVIPILGMGGCGKTTLARKAEDDPSIKSRSNIQVWVTISKQYHLREVLLGLVRCINTGDAYENLSDDQLMEKAYRALKDWKYLVVVDDIWSTNIWDLIARTLPGDKIGSCIILTTRLKEVAKYVNPDLPPHEMVPLSVDESWKLLCNKLYGVEQHSLLELEEIGKNIVGKCQGLLPLAILVVAGHLSKIPMTTESWAIVAKNVSKVVTSYPDQCLAILAMSYHHLPIHLKPCFLHMGTFPENFVIDTWRLIRHWVAEGFLKSDRLKGPEKVAEDCLEDLISREW